MTSTPHRHDLPAPALEPDGDQHPIITTMAGHALAVLRIAAVSGTLLYLLMWSANLPPETNPVIDDHVLGAISVVVLALVAAGNVGASASGGAASMSFAVTRGCGGHNDRQTGYPRGGRRLLA
jgi:hypothetical protein